MNYKSKKLLASLALLFSFSLFAEVKSIEEIKEPIGEFPKDNWVKVAAVQWSPSGSAPLANFEKAKAFKQSNIDTLETYIREAAENGAELIVTPEFGIVGYPDIPELPNEDDNFRNREDAKYYAEFVPGPSTKYFQNLAKELGVYIHVGLMEEDSETNNYHNSVIVLSAEGEFVTKYRKIHLFQIEVNYLVPGDEIVTYDGPAGKTGMIICSDVYSDFPMNEYAKEKLDLMALSTSWAQYNTGWSYFTRGAKWLKSYFLAANHNFFPDSGMIQPNGVTQSHIRQSTGLVYGYVPRKVTK